MDIYIYFKQLPSKRENVAATLSYIFNPGQGVCWPYCSSLSRLLRLLGVVVSSSQESSHFLHNGSGASSPLCFLGLIQDASVIGPSQELVVKYLFCQVRLLFGDPITAIASEFRTRSGFGGYSLHLGSTPQTSLCVMNLLCSFVNSF